MPTEDKTTNHNPSSCSLHSMDHFRENSWDEVTKFTEIKTEVGICMDLLTIPIQIGDCIWHCAKNGTNSKGTDSIVKKSLLVCTFQCNRRPVKTVEKKWVEEGNDILTAHDQWQQIRTDRNTVSWNREVMKIQVLAYTSQPRFWFHDLQWPSTLRTTQGQYPS